MVHGIVSQPGDDASEFIFITPDDTEIKTGEFVYYTGKVKVENEEGDIEDQEKKIFARVTGRTQYRGYPDQFMSNPEVSPSSIATKLGMDSDNVDIYRITAKVIGYFDDRMDDFTNPRIVPKPGTRISLAENEDLEKHLTNVDTENEGSAFIGDLLHRPPGATNIELPIDSFASTHLSILASTGSGKSYTASVFLEEMMQPDSRAAVLVLDPHGEYGSLEEMEEMDQFQSEDGNYSPKIQVKKSEDMKIKISELSFSDIMSVIDNPSDAQEKVLADGWDQVKNDTHVSPDKLKQACNDEADNENVAAALEWRIDKALNKDMFDQNQNVSLNEILSPGQCTVLKMNKMGLKDQQMLASVLLRKINKARVAYEKNDDSKEQLEFPVFTLLEEGHRFAPANGEARSLGPLSTILSEGRKFGIGIGIISQRPSKIDDDVLSQCKTQVIMQIQNPLDQDAVKKGVEDVGEDLLSELPGLTPGQAIIAGDSVNTPFLVRVRERYTTHAAESLDATKLWKEKWNQNQRHETTGVADDSENQDMDERDETL